MGTVDGGGTPGPVDSGVTQGPTLAAGLGIKEVAVYQGVKIPVVTNGVPVAQRNAPVVANRPGMIRVSVEPAERSSLGSSCNPA